MELSVEVGNVVSFDWASTSIDGELCETFVSATETITNTGNIPLAVRQRVWYNGNTEEIDTYSYEPKKALSPGEPLTYEPSYTIAFSFNSWYDPFYGSEHYTHIVLTPDDPVYLGYSTISVCYYGYDANTI